ncbi:MAG TPA: FecR domain-containing protein [Casimicrobiaceae bacterium]|nr:FecR domain-containing protein [Casimicrobiaceae bacterium]
MLTSPQTMAAQMTYRPFERQHRKAATAWAVIALLLAVARVGSAQAASAPEAQRLPDCKPVIARIVSVEGSVTVYADSGAYAPAHLDEAVCERYVIEVGERSRAALQFANETTIRLDQRSRLVLSGFTPDTTAGLALTRGALHVLTRTRQRFQVTTPFINANVNGTEFTVTISGNEATVALQEGLVCASNPNGNGSARIDGATKTVATYADASCASQEQQRVAAMAVSGTAGQPPTARGDIVVEPADHVKWALYYPAVFDYASAQSDFAALAQPENSPERLNDARVATRYAGLLLSVGRVDDAERFIARALAIDARNSDAHALRAVLAVVRNDKKTALDEGRLAVESGPSSPAAWVALSYAQQSAFEVEQAVTTMEAARSEVAPSALFLARLAELYMSVGEVDKAVRTAEEARALNPQLAKIQTVTGFAYLIRIDTNEAKQAFSHAIDLDPADPLPRLGLGLARIRAGDLAGGRAELEIAAVLDPANSLIRSYLGKAYYDEKRDALAATQFDLAKARDPADPTPLFYDAILQDSLNRPVTALRELQQSVDKNGNRAVYRSKLQIDQDLAARTVNVARIYQDLGFNQLALSEGYNAIAADPGEAAAHLFLADAYANRPRHDIARVSESLQARLRQPAALPAMDLEINSDNLLILRGTGPSRLGTNEFNRLFNRNQVAAQFDGLVGNLSTNGDQVILGGLQNNVAFAASQLHYETDGFRDNGAARKDIYDAFVQADVSARASVQLEVKRADLRSGETFYPFDPDFTFGGIIHERSDSVRVGGRFNVDASSETIWSALHEDRRRSVESIADGFLINEDDAQTYAFEAQHLVRSGDIKWTMGVGYARTDDQFVAQDNIVSSGGSLYLYGQWAPRAFPLRLEGGVAAEYVRADYASEFVHDLSRHRLSPKLGVTWMPTTDTTLRAAALQTVRRPLIGSQTLEPTHVAGCNQFFSGFDNFFGDIMGTVSRRVCLGVDQRVAASTFVGGDVARRKLTVPDVAFGQDYEWKERTAHLYAYRAIDAGAVPMLGSAQAGLSVEYDYERIERPLELTGPEGIVNVTTHRLPVAARFHLSEALSAGVTATYVRQRGTFSIGTISADFAAPVFDKDDRAWLTDIFVDFRLPRRMGYVSVGARNLFNQFIDVFETDPFNPQIPTRRFVYGKLRLVF